ncbi:SDR family oxidoreductase [Hoeflea sp. G2-23]|uniref:SDR family oxidoreductase n=1 Tax=Hoeflea algicola TaxID=2983763 RepID=A0ABT3ZE44_9HYPH|nr:SDR family NAD(P)-dependent oxidoreductase [Hoeflea algicola]MCY0150069.1 SDR family oxidoreductase [Hoeflea algicola]
MTILPLAGKAALITGASGGLGLHFAKLLARNGAEVTLAARRMAKLTTACEDIRASGGTADALEMDVSDGASVTAALASVERPFDILVNNAGISGEGRALDMDEAEFDAVVDTNLKGSFLVAQSVARSLKAAQRGGAIVNVASILGIRAGGGVSAYSASKAGLIHLTKVLALELAGDNIRVNALCPGYIETDINRAFFETAAGQALIKRIPQRRLGRPEDLDGALLLLLGDAGAYITGTTLVADGGHLVSSL